MKKLDLPRDPFVQPSPPLPLLLPLLPLLLLSLPPSSLPKEIWKLLKKLFLNSFCKSLCLSKTTNLTQEKEEANKRERSLQVVIFCCCEMIVCYLIVHRTKLIEMRLVNVVSSLFELLEVLIDLTVDAARIIWEKLSGLMISFAQLHYYTNILKIMLMAKMSAFLGGVSQVRQPRFSGLTGLSSLRIIRKT